MSRQVRIALVEDSDPLRSLLRSTLDARDGWSVVADCGSAEDALERIPDAKPDIILLDIVLGADDDGIKLIAPLKRALPGARVVMLTVVENDTAISRAIHAGACGYIVKREKAHLIAGLEDVLADRAPAMSPSVACRLWNLAQRYLLAVPPGDHGLTPREWDVLRHGSRGKQQGEIALELGIEINTVKKHCSHIYRKLGVNSMREAVLKVQGLPPLPDE
ncbi:MAG: response regulator transcription factor [Verrucomicrobiae bacterium]|nr:response regulator transcription factor [Verrucomicrobiae bacterium]